MKEETFGVDASTKPQLINNSTNSIKQEKEQEEEKTEFDVIIESVQTAKRLTVIKVIRTITSLGLKEAKDLIESLPKTVTQGLSKEKAEEIKKLLEEAGASVLLK